MGMPVRELELNNFIGKGATRLCFAHPSDDDKCIKVAMRYKEEYLLERELVTYKKIQSKIGKYLPKYENELVRTNLGKGLVCERIRDFDGKKCNTLAQYLWENKINNEIKSQIKEFADLLLKQNIIFYDFNLENFIVQITSSGKKKLYYSDIKSYQRYKPWTFLGLERLLPPLAKFLMKKRLERLLGILKINTKL